MNEKFVAVSKIKRQRHFCPISSNSLDKIVRENRMSNLIRYTRKTDPRAKVAFYQANNFSRFNFFRKLCFQFEKQND